MESSGGIIEVVALVNHNVFFYSPFSAISEDSFVLFWFF